MFAANLLNQEMWCAKWRIKLNLENHILQVQTHQNNRTQPKTVWRDTKSLSSSEFLGITFDSQLTFKPHFEDILDCCNTRYHRLKLLANKKWGPSLSSLIQIYKQCVRPIFEYGSLSTITTLDNIISKIQWLQNKFIRLALHLPKYICSKLLHDSTGLMKDRLLSCATKSLAKPSSRGVHIFQQAQPCLGPFPNAIISGLSCRPLVKRELLG